MRIAIVLGLFAALVVAVRAEDKPAQDPGKKKAEKKVEKKAEKKAEKKGRKGKKAPEFTLLDLDGNKRSLKDYKGKFVVLEWCNFSCPFVVKHYEKSGNMPALQKAYGKKDVVWLSIFSTNPNHKNYRDAKTLKKMCAKRKAAPTAALMDADGKVGRAYKAKTTPHMIVVDKAGFIVYDGAIDSVRSTNPADVLTANCYVQEVLDAVLAGKKAPRASSTPYGCSVKYAKKKKKLGNPGS
ncbi:MAG: redoxin domain-containing protein [Planctomycetota bacterium]|jgi:peroxiredoxin